MVACNFATVGWLGGCITVTLMSVHTWPTMASTSDLLYEVKIGKRKLKKINLLAFKQEIEEKRKSWSITQRDWQPNTIKRYEKALKNNLGVVVSDWGNGNE